MGYKNTPESFWRRVAISTPEACWNWEGQVHKSGYGILGYEGRKCFAHRVAAFLFDVVPTIRAPEDKKGTGFVLHSCDNRLCCNPYHFEVGTFKDNLQQASARGQLQRPAGASHHLSKLSAGQRAIIRARRARGDSCSLLAGEYGVSANTIRRVAQGTAA